MNIQKCCVIYANTPKKKKQIKKLASLIIHEVGHFAKKKGRVISYIDSSFILPIYSLRSMTSPPCMFHPALLLLSPERHWDFFKIIIGSFFFWRVNRRGENPPHDSFIHNHWIFCHDYPNFSSDYQSVTPLVRPSPPDLFLLLLRQVSVEVSWARISKLRTK